MEQQPRLEQPVRAHQSNTARSTRSPTSTTSSPQRNDESWVEVSSQPSSSSLSSLGDDIVTTGLRVGSSTTRRRRPHQQLPGPPATPSFHANQTVVQGGTSSQEEYDETESEDDTLLTSSTENGPVQRRQSFHRPTRIERDDSDDEIATALGRATGDPVFRPQPNAFSHPGGRTQRSYSTTSAVPSHPHSRVRPSLGQRSNPRPHRGVPNFMSPSYQADNDEALRSSLTTLLSCAAAARGLPKHNHDQEERAPAAPAGVGPSTQPVELRLVPEDKLGEPSARAPPTARQPRLKTPAETTSPRTASSPSNASAAAVAAADRHKRGASPQSRSSRVAKKKKVVAVEDSTGGLLSPTLLTWVMSAGVLVIVSVVGFGAGYVIGREVGRHETLAAGASANASTIAAADSSCGREVVRSSGGLRRLRWGASVVASA
ncbi:hypothetical protein SODALDRAFT_195420 [Sodiomyces alkalinus F11]|uniref:Uncharacterized protein n=1 Tax=Sodiomyces alkalinus (strain CBS 110278 / VKM F-3762 / F11) TaxID=1314773 RepID=A0A3N2PSI3_SODAK|nr:hypothetical protein SODALDRAFT_195420 [Sodiomyces alkalinus F11]ROT37384.1 hypothetical protein SODALDRAFT_195420 [Sodiomyces alkalinus F11]